MPAKIVRNSAIGKEGAKITATIAADVNPNILLKPRSTMSFLQSSFITCANSCPNTKIIPFFCLFWVLHVF